MPDPEAMRRRGFQVVRALDPDTRQVRECVFISAKRLDFICGRGEAAVLALAECVLPVLVEPTRLYRGVVRAEEEHHTDCWLCYSGLPEWRFSGPQGNRLLRKPNEVFLVYVNAEGVAYHWGWKDSDPDDPGGPLNAQAIFREAIQL